MEPSRFVSVDPHLPITQETLEDWRQALAEVDAFFPSEDELLLEETQVHPERVLPRLATGRLRFIVFKQAARGGILYDAREDRFHRWLGRAAKVIDPTGAGDAFAAGFLAGWLRGESVDVALWRGVVGASFAIADWGAAGLLRADRAAAADRLQAWRSS